MRSEGVRGAKRRGKPWRTTTPDPQARRQADLVQRDFTARRPNELWVADFSYLRCWESVVFFSFVIDVYSRMVVGWQFARHMRTTLVLDALRMALCTRERVDEVRLVHHSDRGSQYTSGEYTQTLDDHGVRASVGATGDAYDNALAESFVDSFKTELITDRVWATRNQLEVAIVEYIAWFNNERTPERVRWWHGAIFARHFPYDGGRFREERAYFGVVTADGGMRQIEGSSPDTLRRNLAEVCASFNGGIERLGKRNASVLEQTRVAGAMYAGILRVHPFADGNHRAGFVALSAALWSLGLPAVEFARDGEMTDHGNAIAPALFSPDGDIEPFARLLASRIEYASRPAT
jgi:putative transposase